MYAVPNLVGKVQDVSSSLPRRKVAWLMLPRLLRGSLRLSPRECGQFSQFSFSTRVFDIVQVSGKAPKKIAKKKGVSAGEKKVVKRVGLKSSKSAKGKMVAKAVNKKGPKLAVKKSAPKPTKSKQ